MQDDPLVSYEACRLGHLQDVGARLATTVHTFVPVVHTVHLKEKGLLKWLTSMSPLSPLCYITCVSYASRESCGSSEDIRRSH